MAAVQHLSKKAATVPCTVRTLASGVPVAPLVSLAARQPAGHGHAEHAHGEAGPRADVPARWAFGVSRTAAGLVSKSFTSGEWPFRDAGEGRLRGGSACCVLLHVAAPSPPPLSASALVSVPASLSHALSSPFPPSFLRRQRP